MPVKTVTIHSKDAAWINADICWAIKQRYKLFKKKKTKKTHAAIKTKIGELIGLRETR